MKSCSLPNVDGLGIATRYDIDGPLFENRSGERNFLPTILIQPCSRTDRAFSGIETGALSCGTAAGVWR